jgi:DNA-binding XRE family transcriptional regulator
MMNTAAVELSFNRMAPAASAELARSLFLEDPEAVKRARRAACITQDEMARRLGVSRVSISLWETGKSRPLRENARQYFRHVLHSGSDLSSVIPDELQTLLREAIQ